MSDATVTNICLDSVTRTLTYRLQVSIGNHRVVELFERQYYCCCVELSDIFLEGFILTKLIKLTAFSRLM